MTLAEKNVSPMAERVNAVVVLTLSSISAGTRPWAIFSSRDKKSPTSKGVQKKCVL